MSYYDVMVADVGYRGDKALTYSYDSAVTLQKGTIVTVPLRSKKVLGVVADKTVKPIKISPKEVLRVHTTLPLPDWYIPFCKWMSTYYPSSTGQVLSTMLPGSLKQYSPDKDDSSALKSIDSLPKQITPTLTQDQKTAWSKIETSKDTSVLLHGVTGSGKTRLYLELILQKLRGGESVILLTPEIGLTPQLEQELRTFFGNRVVVNHSSMKATERRTAWLACLRSDEPLVVIGPRSTLFSPLKHLGAIIIDEAHDGSYRQDQSPHYNAVRAGAAMSKLASASLVLGTATPNIVDYHAFKQKKLPIISLEKTAIHNTFDTTWKIISSNDRSHFSRSPWISNEIIKAVEDSITNSEQSLIYLNRRGTARHTVCEDCGWKALCPECDSPLVYHADKHMLHCHHCETSKAAITMCPECKGNNISLQSIGTKMIQSELTRLFPQARIARFDRDTEQSISLAAMYKKLQDGSIDIIIGTQMISKGLDLPKLSVVAMLQGDNALNIPDYTAEEELYQQINQLKGRVGRGHRKGAFLLQARQPDHSIIDAAMRSDYATFYKNIIQQRKIIGFPPFSHLLKITASRKSQKAATSALTKLRKEILETAPKGTVVLGPAPATRERIKDTYHWSIVVKARHRSYLIQLCNELKPNFRHDIDPDKIL